MKAVLGATDVNGFTVTAAVSLTNENAVLLTDDLGDTYVYNSTLSTNTKIATSSGNKYATAVIKYTVSYSGTAANADAVDDLWDAIVGNVDMTITLSDTTVYNSDNGFASAMASVNAANKGLKIFDSEHDFVYDKDENATPYAKPADENTLTVEASTLKGLVFSGSAGVYAAPQATAGTKYIGIMGVNSVVQDGDDTYEVTITPSATWLTAYGG